MIWRDQKFKYDSYSATESSRFQFGGNNFGSTFNDLFQKTNNPWDRKAPLETFKSEVSPLWWAAGNEQPSLPPRGFV